MSSNHRASLTRLTLHQETLRRVVYAPLLAMTALALALVLLITNLLKTVAWVEHSDEVILKATQISKLTVDAQSAKRGYFVNLRPLHLETYQKVTEQIPKQFAHLIELTKDNTRQRRQVRLIWDAYKLWKTQSDIDLEKRRQQGNKYRPDQNNSFSVNVLVLVDNLNKAFDTFLDEEKRLRQERSAIVQKTTIITLIGGSVVLALVGGWLGFATRRQMNQLTHLYGNALDEEQLVRERFSTTLFGIGDAVLVTDIHGKVTLMNPIAEALTGWQIKEAEGKPVTAVFATFQEGTGLPVQNPVARALQAGTIIQLSRNTLLRHRDGTEVAIDDSAAPLKDTEGNLMGVVLVFRDVTEQREHERLRETLSERLRLATEGSGVGTFDFNPNTGTVIADLNCKRYYGIPPDEEMNYASFLQTLHPEDRPHVEAAVAKAIDPTGDGLYSIEYRTIGLRDGIERWVLAQGKTQFNADKTQVTRFTGTVLEITERKHIEAERDALLARQSRVAETLQKSMLLTPLENAYAGISVATLYQAAWDEADIGGDFHDSFSFWSHRVALVVGDVTGKGLEAAAYTAEAKYALRAFLHETVNPSLALSRLNDYLVSEQSNSASSPARQQDSLPFRFVSIALAVMNTETGEVDCVSGGAEPPFILRAKNGEIEEVSARGLVVGATKGTRYKVVRLRLEPGDVLFFTTDGITEARNQDREFFADKELTSTFRDALQSTGTLQEAANLIAQRAQTFAGGKLRDDACLMLVRREANL